VVDRQPPQSTITGISQSLDGGLTLSYSLDGEAVGAKTIKLYYRFQEKDANWTGEWYLAAEQEIEPSNSEPVRFDKDLTERTGFYQFITLATDLAGNEEDWPLETATAKVWEVKADEALLPEVRVWEPLTDREYLIVLGERDGLDLGELDARQNGNLVNGHAWQVYREGTVSLVEEDKGIKPLLGKKMLRFNSEATTNYDNDVIFRLDTNNLPPRTVTFNYQVVSNQSESDLDDIALIAHLGPMGERTAEMNGSDLKNEEVDGWYRSGWQQMQVSPIPDTTASWPAGYSLGQVIFSMNRDLAAGKQVYIYLDRIEYDKVLLSSRSEIRLKNNQVEGWERVAYSYSL
jgi:hypothetical protein